MEELITEFWSKVIKTENCWLWTGCLNGGGYGKFKKQSAHRWIWQATYGPILNKRHFVLHVCDVRNCVNPAHLFLGTALENSRDMVKKNRQRKGSRCVHSKYNEDIVLEIRKLFDSGTTRWEIVHRLGVPYESVRSIISRESWTHV